MSVAARLLRGAFLKGPYGHSEGDTQPPHHLGLGRPAFAVRVGTWRKSGELGLLEAAMQEPVSGTPETRVPAYLHREPRERCPGNVTVHITNHLNSTQRQSKETGSMLSIRKSSRVGRLGGSVKEVIQGSTYN